MTDAEVAAAFAVLADRLIPAALGMPAASTAADLEVGLANVLNSRPDLRADIMRGLRAVHESSADAAVETLQSSDREAWTALGLAAASIYYSAPPVEALLGYRGPERRTYDADATPPYIANGMLDVVRRRGPIWRKA
ncbi:hypothetical protein KX816_03380 [Sphingosinicellaceae bacterium]|nr:hypothetical protein KX816_03380 [Sphingosinicellaceae bacterium]